MENVFRADNAKVFPNGEVFLIRCNITADVAEWFIPPSLLAAFSARVTEISPHAPVPPGSYTEMATWLEDQLQSLA